MSNSQNTNGFAKSASMLLDDVLSELNYLEGFGPAGVAPIPEKTATSVATATAKPTPALNADEAKVVACFAGGAILASDQLVVMTGLPSHSLSAILMMLELKRLVAKRVDGAFEAR